MLLTCLIFSLSLAIPAASALSSDRARERQERYRNALSDAPAMRPEEDRYEKRFGVHSESNNQCSGFYIPQWIPPYEEKKKKEEKEVIKSPPPDPDDDPTPPDDGGGGGLPEQEMEQTIKVVPEEVIPTSKAEIQTTYLTEEEILKQIGDFEIIVSELTTNSGEIKRVDETADEVIVDYIPVPAFWHVLTLADLEDFEFVTIYDPHLNTLKFNSLTDEVLTE